MTVILSVVESVIKRQIDVICHRQSRSFSPLLVAWGRRSVKIWMDRLLDYTSRSLDTGNNLFPASSRCLSKLQFLLIIWQWKIFGRGRRWRGIQNIRMLCSPADFLFCLARQEPHKWCHALVLFPEDLCARWKRWVACCHFDICNHEGASNTIVDQHERQRQTGSSPQQSSNECHVTNIVRIPHYLDCGLLRNLKDSSVHPISQLL